MTIAFKVKKNITLPQLKMDDAGTPIFVKVTSVIKKTVDTPEQVAAKEASKAAGKTVMENPDIFQGVNLETGEEVEVIAGAVLKAELEAAYPNDSYVGLCFTMSKTKVPNKRYSLYKLSEIELETEEIQELKYEETLPKRNTTKK